MKKHRVTPLEVMEIEFLDKTLVFCFDMQAIAKIQEEFGAIEDISKNKNEFEMAAIMLWAGVKDDEFTLDEAKVIVTTSAEVLVDTLTITTDSIVKLGGESNAKKMQEEIEKALMKKKK